MEDLTGRAGEMLRATGFLEVARHAGDTAPDLTLVDARGDSVRLADLWRQGPLVLVFYRGAWCGACMRQLSAWQTNAVPLEQLGGRVVAISPEGGAPLRATIQRLRLSFVLASDPVLHAAGRFGVAQSLVPEMVDLYAYLGAEPAILDGDGQWLQPVPATFVVDTRGQILFAQVDVDGRKRTQPAQVLAALRLVANGHREG